MKRSAGSLVFLLLSLGWCSLAVAELRQQAAPKPGRTLDLVLDTRNQLHGTVVDGQGKAVRGAEVTLLSRGNARWRVHAKADKKGRFVLKNAVNGPATLRIGREEHAVRVWNQKLAPPAAQREGLFVIGTRLRAQCHGDQCDGCDTCRGQSMAGGHFGGFFQRIVDNPWIVGTGTAAAIAVPLAADDDDAS